MSNSTLQRALGELPSTQMCQVVTYTTPWCVTCHEESRKGRNANLAILCAARVERDRAVSM